ncbi:hypothetical protein [Tunturiibacter lichenicola]|uniref:hypothetical protein n=1 Tax=Tunturiibacter lichenicola TaxID=2051959 RepID=UPI003D9B863B
MNESLFEYAQELHERVEAEQSEAADGVDLLLLTLLDTWLRDCDFAVGFIENPYTDNGQRIIFLRQTLGQIDKIIDKVTEHAVSTGLDLSEPLPPAANGLIRFLFAISMDVFQTINTLITIEAGKRSDRNQETGQAQTHCSA